MNLKKLQQSFKLFSSTISAWLNDLKYRVANFDIKPQAPAISFWLKQAYLANMDGHYREAAQHLRRALQCNNLNHAALFELSCVCIIIGNFNEGLRLVKRAIRYYPDDCYLYKIQGSLYAAIGEWDESARSLKQALALNPDMISAQHILDGVEKKHTQIAPRQYIIDTFDQFADKFDDILINCLNYRSHIELAATIGALPIAKQTIPAVLDLGCGTGLFGSALLGHAKVTSLIGVDLSTQMLAKCKERNIYAQLHNSDLIDFLAAEQSQYTCITASDVFVYLGDLSQVLKLGYQRLVRGGYFAFTVEALPQGDFILTHTGRYKHSVKYLTAIQKLVGYSTISTKTIDLRKEYGNIVSGYLVLLQK